MSRVTKTLTVLLAVALLLSFAKAELVELNPENFHSIVNDPSKNVFVMFYAPWCGHCNHMKPAWQELADKYPIDGDTIIARIDASAHRGIGKEYDVNGFPTLKLFTKRDKTGEKQYSGPRELSAFDVFIKSNKM